MSYVLALDQGTTSSRALLFDSSGRRVALAQRQIQASYPRPGWVEQDPLELWSSQLATAREVLEQAGLRAGDVAAIGITNQRETAVLWERSSGRPVGPAIVWQDRRTAERCSELQRRGLEPAISLATGLVLDPYFSATKLQWILDQQPQLRSRAERGELAFGTVDSWLIYQLCGEHVTDPSNACRTLLYSLEQGEWDGDLLELFGIPRALLPRLVASSGLIGQTRPEWFGRPIAVTGVSGDQQAATFGQLCLKAGMAKATYGTGCFVLLHTGQRPLRSQHRLLSTTAWVLGDQPAEFALEGSVFAAGALIDWLRDGLGMIAQAEQVEKLAAGCADSGGVYLVPALNGLGAPHWDPRARGLLIGLTRGSGKAEIARAALEGIAFQVADVLTAMEADGGQLAELRVDGGASKNDLLMQLQADIAGIPVLRPKETETTALGAALLAGLATGIWKGSELSGIWSEERAFLPSWSEDERQHRRTQWRRALERSREWAERE